MEYNTSLPRLIIPEYGRNIQRMIDYAISIEDREKRNVAANAIMQVMGQLNPHLRDFADFKHKLWDHIFIISDFKLDVDSPYPRPTAETFKTKPELVKLIPGFTEISNEAIKINDLDAQKLIYIGTQGATKLKWEQVYLIKNKAVYILSYTATAATFADYAQKIDEMVATIEIK